jgi:hypothetical protein
VWQAIESSGLCFVVEFDNLDWVSHCGTKAQLRIIGTQQPAAAILL